ncbi:conserved unknown protein [Ectocarpus siliculosus]|uniref:Peptidase M24 domain-containing protein n=1 Tax=Ectocarpus siliculosus TaxID=2880 RepID=D8LFA9_ECTSI|nr:conserved unknown protein [Ectocarpus siliculosus]|eukprot:CBN78834.1 conserved unknown protein [Ectocarpus siliculosus]
MLSLLFSPSELAGLVDLTEVLEPGLEHGVVDADMCLILMPELRERCCKEQAGYVSLSFETISGYGPNGAVIHYAAQKETARDLGTDSLFLLDSGAQYTDGTTDVTRTVHFGSPTEHQRRCFTLVLKGHIALARAVFPEDTMGSKLDVLARLALWEAGLDYRHGTGHEKT